MTTTPFELLRTHSQSTTLHKAVQEIFANPCRIPFE